VLSRWIVGISILAALTVSLATGCGGEDDASAEVTKTEFTKEAEAVCAERKKDWDKAIAVYTKEASETEFSDAKERAQTEVFLDEKLLPILQTELKSLEGLDVPAADEEKVESMLQSRTQGIEKLEDKGAAALFYEEPFGAFEKEAKKYGLDCSVE
jgi:hypothetical protein